MRFFLPLFCLLALATPVVAADEQAPANTRMQQAVEEFKIETRNLGLRADGPRKAKNSPKPRFNGRLFHNFRNDFLDAVPHEVSQSGAGKSLLRRNQFGFNLTGPVIIPKLYQSNRRTFFSISYEGVREHIGRSTLRTLPTVPERSGDFSHVVDLAGAPLPIYDPASTRLNPGFDPTQAVSTENLQYFRDPFPNNVIPQNRLDPVAQRALAYYPTPNTNVGPFFQNNYFVVSPQPNTANGVIARVDHTLLDRHRFNFNLSISNGFAGAAKYFDTVADSSSPDRTFQSRRASLDYVFTLSAQSVNTLTVDAQTDGSQDASGQSDFASQVGVTGAGSDVFPVFSLGAYLPMGNANPTSKNTRNNFIYTDAFATRIHKHNLRATAQFAQSQVNTFVPTYPGGAFTFSPSITSLPGINNTGLAFASFVLGAADSAQVSLVPSPSYFRKHRLLFSGRDQYDIRPGLTVAIAGTLQVFNPRTEKFDRQSTVDPSLINPANGLPGALTFAGQNGTGRAFQPTITRLDPSASLAWSPGGNTSRTLRLGYSRSYSPVPVYSVQFGTQGFNGYDTFTSPNVQLEPAVTLSGGVPALHALPDLRPTAANDTHADFVNQTSAIPTTQSASITFETKIPGSVILTSAVYASNGKNLLVSSTTANLDAIPPSALVYRDQLNDLNFRRSLSPYPQYLGLNLYASYPAGRYRRQAAYLRLEKRTSSGLSINAYYEYGKQFDDYSGPYGRQDEFNRHNEWSQTVGVAIQHLSLSYVYELPIGANKPFMAYTDWRHVLVDGWSFSGVSTISGGDPLYLHPQFNNTGGVLPVVNVNVVPGVDPHVPNQGPELWYNPAAFDQPADFTMGNAARTHNDIRLPGSQIHDLSVNKRFSLAAERTLEFSASGFNFTNHANWNDPDNVIGPASAPNLNAGRIIGSRGGRVVQLGLRLSF
ncbi:MAG: hypothetical protein ABI693_01295 [Bryobacteraceae bacterium]